MSFLFLRWKKACFLLFFWFMMYCLYKFAYLYKETNVVE